MLDLDLTFAPIRHSMDRAFGEAGDAISSWKTMHLQLSCVT